MTGAVYVAPDVSVPDNRRRIAPRMSIFSLLAASMVLVTGSRSESWKPHRWKSCKLQRHDWAPVSVTVVTKDGVTFRQGAPKYL